MKSCIKENVCEKPRGEYGGHVGRERGETPRELGMSRGDAGGDMAANTSIRLSPRCGLINNGPFPPVCPRLRSFLFNDKSIRKKAGYSYFH